jgi:hypothetical protein
MAPFLYRSRLVQPDGHIVLLFALMLDYSLTPLGCNLLDAEVFLFRFSKSVRLG